MMSKLKIFSFLGFTFFLSTFSFAMPPTISGRGTGQPTLPKASYVSPQIVREWQAKQDDKVTFVDVREPQEYEAGHIEGYNTPLNSDHWLRCKSMVKSPKPGGQNEEANAVSKRVQSAGGAGGDQRRKNDCGIKRGV